MDKITLTLDPDTQFVVKYLAQRRCEVSADVGAKATLYNQTTVLENTIQSLGAEFAYCNMFNLWPSIRCDGFLPFDAKLRNGETVDIKHTVRLDGRLLVKVMDRKEHPVYYALMVGPFPTYQFIQHYLSKDVLLPELIDRTLKYPAYAVPQGQRVVEVPALDMDVEFDKPPTQRFLW